MKEKSGKHFLLIGVMFRSTTNVRGCLTWSLNTAFRVAAQEILYPWMWALQTTALAQLVSSSALEGRRGDRVNQSDCLAKAIRVPHITMVAFDKDFMTRHVLQCGTSSYQSAKGTQLY